MSVVFTLLKGMMLLRTLQIFAETYARNIEKRLCASFLQDILPN